MTNQLATKAQEHPKDAKTGLTLPLRKHLGSQELARHRATLVVELEIVAKKFDRFGWDRDAGTAAQDGMIRDWMDALQDYPLDEVRAARRAAVHENPNRMPNEGHVMKHILKARAEKMMLRKASTPETEPAPPEAPRVTQEQREAIMAEKGYSHLPSVSAKKFLAVGEGE